MKKVAPIIGVVADRKIQSSGLWVDVETDGLPHSYLRAIEKAGGAPFLIPSIAASLELVDKWVEAMDGLFLPGGGDVDSRLYGQEPHDLNDRPMRIRDDLEIALTLAAKRRGIPIFGACRGMQVINVALGGTLEQHIGERVDLTPHRNVVGIFTSHPVLIKEGSLLEAILPQRELGIASHHHQGVGELGSGLAISARAPDGVIEAIEAIDGSFCIGVQWHPEQQLDQEGLNIIRAFVDASRRDSSVSPA
jgi:putative glutamine amidotransferase